MRAPHLRSLAHTLALVAMLLRALLPPGWMPAPGHAGTIVLCTIDGRHAISPPNGSVPGPKQNHDGPCAFAAAGPIAPPSALVVHVPPEARLVVSRFGAASLFVTRLDRHSHPPRAPPSLA